MTNLVEILQGIHQSQRFVKLRNVFQKVKVTSRQNEGRMRGILLKQESGNK